MKLKHLTIEEIKRKMKEREEYLEKNMLWSHKDKRMKSLRREYSMRVLGYDIF